MVGMCWGANLDTLYFIWDNLGRWNSYKKHPSSYIELLIPYSTGNRVFVGYPTRMKSTQKIWNVHAQRELQCQGTECNLYTTCSNWGWRWGNANFRFGVFKYRHVGISNSKFCFGGLSQRMDPTRMVLCRSGNWLNCIFIIMLTIYI